jgi:FkbM family methyltransferase
MRRVLQRMVRSVSYLVPGRAPRDFDVRGLTLALHPRSDIGRRLRAKGAFEDREIDLAAALLLACHGEHRSIVDVGANVGIHSLLWARAFPHASVHAIEPAPSTHALLRANIERNGMAGRVHPLPYAACERDAEVEFFVSEDDAFSSLRDTRRKRVREIVRVPGRRLDGLDLGPVGLLKVDVEGFETQALAGAAGLLAQHRPVIFVEIYGGTNSNPDPEATVRMVVAHGYRPYVFVRRVGLVPFARHDDRRQNYFFLPR